jgi:hypothetical protein
MHSTTERLIYGKSCSVVLEKVYHIRTGCWKQEYKEGGWSVEKGFSPSEIGGYWLDLNLKKYKDDDNKQKSNVVVKIYPTY